MKAIEKLVIKDGWTLKCWDDRYGRGIWAIISPAASFVDEFQDITWGADIESLELGFYFAKKGSWLPVVNGKELLEVLESLDEKIKPLVENDEWQKAVYNAFERIVEVNDGAYGLAAASRQEEVFEKPKGIPEVEPRVQEC